MAKYKPKTKVTEVDPRKFIDKVKSDVKRKDGHELVALMQDITGAPPKMWGPSIIGFGAYHYRYASGHEGDAPRLGFSPRKAHTVLYIVPGFSNWEVMVARLGKVKTSVACLYINRLDQIDMDALRELAAASLVEMRERFPD